MRLPGCEWEYLLHQNDYEEFHNGVPAHFLELQINDIKGKIDENGSSSRINNIYAILSLQVRTINLLMAGTEAEMVDMEMDQRKELEGNQGTGDTTDLETALKDGEDESLKAHDTVRFQFDGTLKMNVTVIDEKELDCDDDVKPVQEYDPLKSQSFHLVPYMEIFKVDIGLYYEINKEEEIYCHKVDDKIHRIQIQSNVGMDSNSGFPDFFNKLAKPAQDKLSKCSSVPCIEGITHEAANATYSGFSGKRDLEITAGRPEPFNARNTKYVHFEVFFGSFGDPNVAGASSTGGSEGTGGTGGGVKQRKKDRSNSGGGSSFSTGSISGGAAVKHRAEFFIEGLYSKGIGQSLALPTYKPIMVLRDPPGNLTKPSFSNVKLLHCI